MSLERRSNSKYWYSVFQLNGKRYIRSTKTTNRDQAQRIDQSYYQKALDGVIFGNHDISLQDSFNLYIKKYDERSTYYQQILVVMKWLSKNMDTSIFVKHIDTKWMYSFVDLRKKYIKSSTLNHNIRIVDRVVKFSKTLGYDVADYTLPDIKVKQTKIEMYDDEEKSKLLKELKTPSTGKGFSNNNKVFISEWYGVVLLLFNTGCRSSEILELQWINVNLKEKTLKIYRKKTDSLSILPMSDEVYDYLNTRDRTSKYVFPSCEDVNLPKKYNSIPIKNACKRAGIPYKSLHKIRHGVITQYLKAGLSIPQAMVLSGHKSISSLAVYSHLTHNDVIDAARTILNINSK